MKVVESVLMFAFLVYFASCIDSSLAAEEMEIEVRGYPNVDRELWPHFEAFEEAAAVHGFRIDLRNQRINGRIEEIPQQNVAGTCSYRHRNAPKDVVLDDDFWRSSSNTYREYIVFHELGHCVLGRGHKEACLNNRTWASIMRSGTGECRDNYSARTRDYYVEELFSTLMRP